MDNLVEQFRSYATIQKQEGIKSFYEDIASALADEDFVQTLRCSGFDGQLKDLERTFGFSISEYDLNSYRNILGNIRTLYAVRKLENGTVVSAVRREAHKLERQVQAAQADIANISKVSGILSGAEMLEAYAKDFDSEAKEHEKKARNWLGWLIVSIIGLVVLATLLLCVQLSDFAVLNQLIADEFKEKLEVPRIVALAIKGGVVAAYAQIPLFLKKNYYAERHLEQANIHRRNVLRSLHAVYNTVSDEGERNRLLVIGATIAFSEPESGFITRKEGAGSDNSSIDALLKTFIR